MMGYNPKAIPTVYPRTNVPATQDRIQGLQKIWDEALAAHELARRKMAGRITKNFKPFEKGQKVWLEGKNLKLGYDNRKLKPLREGPFEITEVLGPLTYRLKLPKKWKIHDMFYASILTPYQETEAHGPNYMNPPPDIIDGDEEYKVEAILGHRMYRGYPRFLIKWEGYPHSENTYKPEGNIHALALLDAYKKRHKLA